MWRVKVGRLDGRVSMEISCRVTAQDGASLASGEALVRGGSSASVHRRRRLTGLPTTAPGGGRCTGPFHHLLALAWRCFSCNNQVAAEFSQPWDVDFRSGSGSQMGELKHSLTWQVRAYISIGTHFPVQR